MIVVTMLAVMTVSVGCKKPAEPTVLTVAVVEDSVAVMENRAAVFAKVTDNGGAEITRCGFCYGVMGSSMDTVTKNQGEGVFSMTLYDLLPATTYTYKAFAANSAGQGYSEEYQFTTLGEPIPVVKTYGVTDIGTTTAKARGQVLSDGGQTLGTRGVCYSTEPHPTTEDMVVTSGESIGWINCELTDLTGEMVYYLRAYVVATEGVYYGEEKQFITACPPLEVKTYAVSDITATRVKCEGEVTCDGCFDVTERGFCWGKMHEPTLEDLHVEVGEGIGEFEAYFSGFERGVTHYVRAYAINEKGVYYGNELEFVPYDPLQPWADGMLPGVFSVAPDRKVRFSQGNLQYKSHMDIWRFAERQWDFVGGSMHMSFDPHDTKIYHVGTVYEDEVQCDNTLITLAYEGWVDLFGWGTSGWNNGNLYYQPYEHASNQLDSDYYGPTGKYDLTGGFAHADWGVHNTISNGGSRQWRTPTYDELHYILIERVTPSGIRFANATVAGVCGVIILPDDWTPNDYPLKVVNSMVHYSRNVISGADWVDVLEPAGAVFLPACGNRYEFSRYDGVWFDWFNNEKAIDYAFFSESNFSPFYISGSYWTATHGESMSYAMVMKVVGYYSYFYDGFFSAALYDAKAMLSV